MIITTSENIVGKRIVRTIGLAKGNTIRTRHVGQGLAAFVRSLVGGEVTNYTKLLAEAREQAIDRMVEDARAMGGNAVVMCRFSTAEIMQGAAEIIAFGTAVVVEEE